MLTKRIIPVLLLKNGHLVRSQYFNFHQIIGNPLIQLERYNAWDLDELIYLDISPEANHQTLEILRLIAKKCFMPLTFGGGIKSLHDIEQRLNLGADKITINTQAVLNPELITKAAHEFGQQAIIVSIDIKCHSNGIYEVYTHGGRVASKLCPFHWAKEAQDRGAGEIIVQSIDKDGSTLGYDTSVINEIAQTTSIPVIACSGASNAEDIANILTQTDVSAAAAANLFLFQELSYWNTKQALIDKNINIRS
ncbi:imidazole glycerol phosphate synthase cyclase subunit [Candidatus Berkiella cookevillensis]|uniref:imidazole glycerol-phosphate synthase n=1 Tax=Candidatus Berkiella cookevillensis TaxID=437022 RepID=A0A0Q9YGK1_9GAMM|nr:imidazole glycerol phosphate synthase cyclase subunit [Candidatus Berkiella cookevillensis]MCS5707683.1 imidazole glycerol phosphate synthase cyclase subunit [Candidatus Berkiella cookevillensis]